jgi:hypothetical protein
MPKRYFYCSLCEERDTLESLQTELNRIKRDIDTIKQMEISGQAKQLPLLELQIELEKVKEKMHKLVDEL